MRGVWYNAGMSEQQKDSGKKKRKPLISEERLRRLREVFANPDPDSPQFWPPEGKSWRTLRKEGKRFSAMFPKRPPEDQEDQEPEDSD